MRIQFKYKNHEGKIEDRDVDVVAFEFSFMNHPEHGYQPGWCFSGWDFSRGRDGSQYRSFYLHNVILPDTGVKFVLMKLPLDASNLRRAREEQ